MSNVTYKNQPAIQATGGLIPLSGTSIPYTVTTLLWPPQVERWLYRRLVGKTLHICCGKSKLGDCRMDLYQANIDVRADAAHLPFADLSWDTVLIDPPYNGVFQWNHDMLSELARVARQRIIFQHWFLPTDRKGRFKKAHRFTLTEVALWPPKSYFGRVQVLTVMDSNGIQQMELFK